MTRRWKGEGRVGDDGEWKRQYLQTPLIFRSFPPLPPSLPPSSKKKRNPRSKKKKEGGTFQKPGTDNSIVENNDAISASCAVFTPLTKREGSPKRGEKVAHRADPFKGFVSITGRLDRTFVNRTLYPRHPLLEIVV